MSARGESDNSVVVVEEAAGGVNFADDENSDGAETAGATGGLTCLLKRKIIWGTFRFMM